MEEPGALANKREATSDPALRTGPMPPWIRLISGEGFGPGEARRALEMLGAGADFDAPWGPLAATAWTCLAESDPASVPDSDLLAAWESRPRASLAAGAHEELCACAFSGREALAMASLRKLGRLSLPMAARAELCLRDRTWICEGPMSEASRQGRGALARAIAERCDPEEDDLDGFDLLALACRMEEPDPELAALIAARAPSRASRRGPDGKTPLEALALRDADAAFRLSRAMPRAEPLGACRHILAKVASMGAARAARAYCGGMARAWSMSVMERHEIGAHAEAGSRRKWRRRL